ncbi:MAG: cytochrome c biosis protein CcmH [Actinomycetota bacterium]
MSRVAKSLKSPAGWIVLLFVFVVALAVGIQRDSGPSTPQERIDAVSQRLACPTCDGESVFESRGSASVAIRNEITRLVSEGRLTDGEIVRSIESSFGSDVLLVPRASGIEGLVWALPVAVAVVAVVFMGFVFQRWRRESRTLVATDSDEVLVAQARRSRSGR